MNRESLHDEDEDFQQMDAPQPTNADRQSDKKSFPEKDLRAPPLDNSIPPLPLAPPIAGQTVPSTVQPTVDPMKNSQAPSHLTDTRQPAGPVKREFELANLPSALPPVVPSQPGLNVPAPPVFQGTDARFSFGTIQGQMKQDMPPEVVTRLNTIYVFCYINTLFLLLYFSITVAVRFINEPNSVFSSRAAFIIYITLELLNLLMTVVTYKVAEGLTRGVMKCWVWCMLLNAILNLILGIVVFSYSTEDKTDTWNAMNSVTKRYYNNDSDSYKVEKMLQQSAYRVNMALIGIFLIVELIVFLVMSFVVYLLFSILLENGNYKPKFGRKPFLEVPYFKKNDVDEQAFTMVDVLTAVVALAEAK